MGSDMAEGLGPDVYADSVASLSGKEGDEECVSSVVAGALADAVAGSVVGDLGSPEDVRDDPSMLILPSTSTVSGFSAGAFVICFGGYLTDSAALIGLRPSVSIFFRFFAFWLLNIDICSL